MSDLLPGRGLGESDSLEPASGGAIAIVQNERLLNSLASLAQALGAARDLITIFRSLRDFALESTQSSTIFISLYDPAREVREGVYLWHEGKEIDQIEVGPVPVGEGPTGRAIKTGAVIISNDYLKEIEGRRTIAAGFDRDPRMPQSAMVASMAVMGRTVGAVEIQSHELDAYTKEHAATIKIAANLCAVAVENVRLLDRERAREEQLRQAQKLEAVGRLAGGIAHDFNNLLTVINGHAQLALMKLGDSHPVWDDLNEIKRAGERAASLTRQLLAFSRKQVIQPRVIDLNSVVTGMEKMLRRLIGEDIELITVIRPETGNIKADPGQVEQVILNLAVNARDAMPLGGKLVIETACVVVDEEGQGNCIAAPGTYAALTVSDTGCGMDMKTLARIFEPFFTTKEKGRGTGLGLSMAYGIVEQSGGYISAESEPGRGAAFKVYFPQTDTAHDLLDVIRSSPSTESTGENILLVEDDEMVRRLAREILEMNGYSVLAARSGAEALSICRTQEKPIGLLVTDVVMPHMNGRQLAEELVLLYPMIKVLYMSGYNDENLSLLESVEPGHAYLEKPFTPDSLAAKVRELLQSN